MLNIIKATFYDKPCAWTDEQWQWDYGQILQFEGLELPEAYEVHFSNIAIGGESITQIGNADGVTIPDQFFTTGETIYAWVYLHQGEDDGETVYSVTIPVKKRPKPSDTPPTPQEQSAIDQAIAALNVAVEKAETAAEDAETAAGHYPKIEDGYWYVWDVESEDYVSTGIKALGDDGTSPTVTVTAITGGHKVTITDVDGDHVFDVMDGTDGNGIQSIAKTSTVGNVDTYTITYTNGQTTTFTVTNGITPTVDDELSDESENPVQNKVITGKIGDLKAEINQLSESIAPVESTTTATAAHAVGELFMVGETLMVALSAIAIGDTITTEGSTPNAAVTTLSGEMIKDVQVNGTSVVTNGVANIPVATTSELGLIKFPGASYGIGRMPDGTIYSASATNADVKIGTVGYKPISPETQHAAAFYGLAKAASDTTQSASSNPVGTYTDAAKSKISDMLNAPITVSGTTPTITAMSGVRYVCGEVATLSITPPASGDCEIMFTSGSTPTVLTVPNTVKWANGFEPTSLDAGTVYDMIITDGTYGMVASWAV